MAGNKERFKILISDPLLKEMVNEADRKFSEHINKIDFAVMDRVDEQELYVTSLGNIIAVVKGEQPKYVIN